MDYGLGLDMRLGGSTSLTLEKISLRALVLVLHFLHFIIILVP